MSATAVPTCGTTTACNSSRATTRSWRSRFAPAFSTVRIACESSEQNVLLRVLGGGPDVDVDLQEVPVVPGDYLLLCSDGLTRMVQDAALADAIGRLRAPQRICDYLIDAANRNGGADNITIVVVEIVESWWRPAFARLRASFG